MPFRLRVGIDQDSLMLVCSESMRFEKTISRIFFPETSHLWLEE